MPAGFATRDKLQRNNAPAVISSKLIRECVHIPGVPASDDKGGRGGKLYLDRAEKQNQRYLRSLAQNLELHNITCLLLSHQFIAKIDNLVGLPSLTKLHLDNNFITKIENLSHLSKLEWLDLSFNKIKVIEGLENLTELQDLSLYNNKITTVEGLDNLKKLTCLSLGDNLIDQLDTTARYLHGLPSIRMLTLSGNAICASKPYKSRIISFVGDKIRYLDSRLVLPRDIAAAKEEQSEHLVAIREEDEKVAEMHKHNAELEKEQAMYVRWNCPPPTQLLSILDGDGIAPPTPTTSPLMQVNSSVGLSFSSALAGSVGLPSTTSMIPTGTAETTVAMLPVVRDMIQHDVLKDRLKEVVDKYTDDMSQRAQELATYMEKTHHQRTDDAAGLEATIEYHKSRCDDSCKELISNYERLVKSVIPPGLRVQPDADTYDETAMLELRTSLGVLKEELLEIEADQFDAFEAVLSVLDDNLSSGRNTVTETLSSRFDEMRQLEKQYADDLKNRLLSYFDDKNRQDGEITYHRGGIPDGIARLLDNKDECIKVVGEVSEFRTRKLDELEELHKRVEDQRSKAALESAQKAEFTRNRNRVFEIHAYCDRQEQRLNAWENAFDGI